MSRRDDIKKLIAKNTRRLQKLNEKKASFGLDTPTHILIEIEDVEAELEKLNSQLDRVKDADDVSSDKAPTSILQFNNFKILMLGIGVVIIVVLSVSIPIIGRSLATATPTATSTSTSTATSTPNPIATPTGKILFEEDFEDNDSDAFNFQGRWEIVQDVSGNNVFEIDNMNSPGFANATFGEKGWGNYVIECRIEIVDYNKDTDNSGFAYLGFRESDESGQDIKNGYRVSLSPSDNLIRLWSVHRPKTGWNPLDSNIFDLQLNTPYDVRIVVYGDQKNGFLGDVSKVKSSDTYFYNGLFSLGVGPDTIAQFDDIRITELRR